MTNDVPTRLAATVLLVRDGAEGLEVFMVVRHHAIDFASGALVFPGGKVEPEDHAIAADSARSGAPSASDPTDDRASRVAAVRETFEECGVLLARPREGAAAAPPAETSPFIDRLDADGLAVTLDALTPFAHWITPPIMPKRFDTRFYIAMAPADQLARHDGHESVDSVWINPAKALREAKTGKYTLVLATRLNLEMLAQSQDAASALAQARARKIVTVEPLATKSDSGYVLTIPVEAGYGGPTFVM